jgi:PIN domain nuclease of toxin-antitoxin system
MILLDTHVCWWLAYEPEKLSARARNAIQLAEDKPGALALSSASLYELTWLAERKRLSLSVGAGEFLWEIQLRFLILPIDQNIAISAARLPSSFHGDPMDRLIVATALKSSRILITADEVILASSLCQTLW